MELELIFLSFVALKNTTTWFSDEEIRNFILTEMVSETDEAREIDECLARVNRLIPETLEYYRFPESWASNGLAQLVKTVFHIPDIDND